MTPQELKTHLTAIQNAKYATDGVDVPAITEAMLTHIGNPDPDLRDALIYPVLARWMGKVIGVAEMLYILFRLLDDAHLFYRIGEKDTDSVFTRSFSLLAIVLIIYPHREQHFLTNEELAGVLERVLDYARQEEDLRGHTGEKGWAHSMAHLADLLDDLALCEEFGTVELQQILGTIQRAATTSATLYHHEEDERMAYATLNLFGRGVLSDAECTTWLEGLVTGILPRQPFTMECYTQRVNLKQYLRSLYLQAIHKGVATELHPAILAAERQVALFQ
jgi:hypothetical protein